LQCVAVCCSALQCVAVCCSVLQCVAMCCSALPYSHMHKTWWVNVCCSVLQCVAVCCIVLQCVGQTYTRIGNTFTTWTCMPLVRVLCAVRFYDMLYTNAQHVVQSSKCSTTLYKIVCIHMLWKHRIECTSLCGLPSCIRRWKTYILLKASKYYFYFTKRRYVVAANLLFQEIRCLKYLSDMYPWQKN